MAHVEKEEKERVRVVSLDAFKKLIDLPGWEWQQKVKIVQHFVAEEWEAEVADFVYVISVVGVGVKFKDGSEIQTLE